MLDALYQLSSGLTPIASPTPLLAEERGRAHYNTMSDDEAVENEVGAEIVVEAQARRNTTVGSANGNGSKDKRYNIA